MNHTTMSFLIVLSCLCLSASMSCIWYPPPRLDAASVLSATQATGLWGWYKQVRSSDCEPQTDLFISEDTMSILNPASWGWGSDYPTGGSATLKGSVLGAQTSTTPNIQPQATPGQMYSQPIGPQPNPYPAVQQYKTPAGPAPKPTGGGNPSPQPQQDPYANIRPSGPSQQEIDSSFNPILDVYNQAEGNLRGQLPGLISEAEAQANVSRRMLGDNKASTGALLDSQGMQSQQLQQAQTAQQRQTLQELQMANRQRFGGASSAGQAASELQGREFQRNTYQIGQQAQQALMQINQERQKVEREYTTGLEQLEVNRQKAVNDIQRTFQDRLLEINARRGETESAKAQARMSALQDLRNQAYQIDVSRAQFQAQLQLQAQQNTSQLDTIAKSYLSAQNTGQDAVSGFANAPQSAIPGVTPNAQGAQTGYTGQIRKDDEVPTGQMGYQPPDLLSGLMTAINPRQQFSYGSPVLR